MEALTKRCNTCGEVKPLKKFKKAWAGFNTRKWNTPGYAERNPLQVCRNRCASCDSKSELAKMKLEMLAAFDCMCSCCGESHPDLLTLDHVENNGGEHRKTMNEQQCMRLARREGWDKSKWDCLCFNCNCAKAHYGGCPHKTGLTAEMAIQRLQDRNLKIGRAMINYAKGPREYVLFATRQGHLSRRVLKPCQYCGKDFGSNEMVRHKRAIHAGEFSAMRAKCLSKGHGWNKIGTGLAG